MLISFLIYSYILHIIITYIIYKRVFLRNYESLGWKNEDRILCIIVSIFCIVSFPIIFSEFIFGKRKINTISWFEQKANW